MKIIYITAFDFSGANAASKRVINNLEALLANHIEVKVFSLFGKEKNYIEMLKEGKIQVTSIEKSPQRKLNFFASAAIRIKAIFKLLDFIKKDNDFTHIILYSGYSIFSLPLLLARYFKNFKLLFDSVEFYEPKNIFETFSFVNIDRYLANRILFFTFDGIIVISKFLENHFIQKTIWGAPKVIRIPPLIGQEPRLKKIHFGKGFRPIKLIYAGEIGKNKDRLEEFLDAYLDFIQNSKLFHITLIGENHNELQKIRSYRTLKDKFPSSLKIINRRITLEEVRDKVAESHFVVFFREKNLISIAGFPTKFVEALSQGTPVITNDVGDIINFIEDGENSFISNNKKEEIKSKLAMIASLEANKYMQISQNAFHTSLQFNYTKYKKPLYKFLKDI